MHDTVRVERREGVGTITLVDPDNHNRLDPLHSQALLSGAFRDLGRDRSVRAIVLAAEGPDFSFSADGRDPEPVDPSDALRIPVERLAHGYSYGVLWEALDGVRKPIVAAVRGRCEGGGMGLALVCDAVVAGRSALFRATDVERGQSPFSPLTRILANAVGKHRAAELVLLGRPIDALGALKAGLVNEVVDDDECEAAAWWWASAIADRAPVAIALARNLVKTAVAEMADYELTRSYAYHTAQHLRESGDGSLPN
jgi:enoyl-CoA hydratase/carnithine racemase